MAAIRRLIRITSRSPDSFTVAPGQQGRKMRAPARPKRLPHKVWYITNNQVRRCRRPSSRAVTGETQIGNLRKNGGPRENVSLHQSSAHRGAVDRAAFRGHGDLFGGAGARGACAAPPARAVSGKIPACADETSLRRRRLLSALRPQPKRAGLFLDSLGVERHRLYAAARRAFRVPRLSIAFHRKRPRARMGAAARAAPLLLIASVFP